ncbi:MAG: hypothetical protein JW900_08665 [Anaerolineae bacterium]|nr:hypothetical protein [Anaerolineae bacterium]
MKKQAKFLVCGIVVLLLALVCAVSVAAGPLSPVKPPEFQLPRPNAVWGTAWVPILRGQTLTFTHNLGGDPDDYAVELLFLDLDDGMGINRAYYGGMEVNGQWYGAHWENLTSNTIQVYRHTDDTAADLIRLRVWGPLDPPDYDSGWLDVSQGETITLSHGVGVTATDLTVGLWFSGTVRGIHQFGFGGLGVDGPQQMLGAHWQNLTDSTVEVIRHPNDTDVEQVRMIVVHGTEPDYDSLEELGDWQDVAAGDVYTFTHNLNWSPNMLLIRGECYDSSGMRGIHMLFAGGNHDWFNGGQYQGVHLQNITGNSVTVFRQPEDEFCPQVRLRIWKRSLMIYLPLLNKES